jgi:hypothetical protein
MKQLFLFVLCFLASYFLPAQEVKKTYTVRYTYPEFKAGFAHFRNGNLGGSKMNYNCLLSEMQFINGTDTLSIAKVEDIAYLVIESDTFYYQKGWIRQIAVANVLRIGEKKALEFANREKIGAFDQVNHGSSVDNVENISTINNIQKSLQAKQMLIFAEHTIFYFSDKYGRFTQASKKNLVNTFGNKYRGLEKFLEDGRFNYQNASDMKKVFDYLTSR